MQSTLIRFIVSTLVLLAASLPLQAAEKFVIDNQHSYVLWHIMHLGFSMQTGKWYVNKGVINLDKENPQNSTVEATIDVANVITGIPELDKHLKEKKFFDVEHYPTATFISRQVEITSPATAKVHGVLTLRGLTKPVTLMVIMNKVGISPIHKRMTVGFSANTMIKLSDFGMNALLPALGDDVTIDIGVEAYKPSA